MTESKRSHHNCCEQANSHVITAIRSSRASRMPRPCLLGEQTAKSWAILSSWVASGHHQFGSGTQERSAANARLPFHLLIEEASGFVNDAQE